MLSMWEGGPLTVWVDRFIEDWELTESELLSRSEMCELRGGGCLHCAVVGDLEAEVVGIGSFAWRCKNKEIREEKICCRRERERERGGKNCSVTGLVVERRKKEVRRERDLKHFLYTIFYRKRVST